MNGFQLSEAFRKNNLTNIYFKGCYLNRNIPHDVWNRGNGFFVVNTFENSDSIGHWVLFYIRNYEINFFDSLGGDPVSYSGSIKHVFENFQGKKSVIFKNPIQSASSSVCGAYCIFFGYQMVHNKSIFNIKSKFNNNLKRNDLKVVKYVNKILDIENGCTFSFCHAYMYLSKCNFGCKCK